MKENIQKLYNQLNDKSEFISEVAMAFGNTPQSIANHWFGRFWSIPEEHRPKVVKMLQDKVDKQNQKASA